MDFRFRLPASASADEDIVLAEGVDGASKPTFPKAAAAASKPERVTLSLASRKDINPFLCPPHPG